MLRTTAVDVVNGEELNFRLAATSAFHSAIAVVRQYAVALAGPKIALLLVCALFISPVPFQGLRFSA
jgi:hypothetical protein